MGTLLRQAQGGWRYHNRARSGVDADCEAIRSPFFDEGQPISRELRHTALFQDETVERHVICPGGEFRLHASEDDIMTARFVSAPSTSPSTFFS